MKTSFSLFAAGAALLWAGSAMAQTFKSNGAGVIDLIMSPQDPTVLFAAVWEFDRKAWGAKTDGPESGLWKSADGGDT